MYTEKKQLSILDELAMGFHPNYVLEKSGHGVFDQFWRQR